jgi:biotin carboxylase
MDRTVLMVGAGAMGHGYLAAARRLRLRMVLVDHPDRQELYAPLVHGFVPCPDPAEESWVAAALDAATRYRPDAVLAFSEPQVLAAAWVQARLGLPGPSLPAAQASRDKALQRVLLDRDRIGQPEFHIATGPAPAQAWARSRYPVVVKSLRGSGSTGVRLVDSEPELTALLRDRWPPDPVLIEEYISAPEYSWEALIQAGMVRFGSYTHKRTSGPPQFVELGHALPSQFTTEQRALLDTALAGVVRALGVDSAVVHAEFRFDGTTVAVMETAVRTPGDNLMELLNLAYGHDFFEACLMLALGEPVSVPRDPVRSAAVGFLTAPPGRIEAIDGIDVARGIPGVDADHLAPPPGARVYARESSYARVEGLIAADPDGDVAAGAVSEALAAIQISTLPSDCPDRSGPRQPAGPGVRPLGGITRPHLCPPHADASGGGHHVQPEPA